MQALKSITGVFCVFFIFSFIAEDLYGQTRAERREERRAERQERREWRKQAREHRRNPLEFRDKIEGYEATIADQNDEIDDLKAEVDELNATLDSVMAAVTIMEDERKRGVPADAPEGVSFKVQVGAYEKFNINHYFDRGIFITPESDDQFNKYVIGYFTDLNEASDFRKDMRKIGVKDAWVVPYLDGERISDDKAEELLGQPFRSK